MVCDFDMPPGAGFICASRFFLVGLRDRHCAFLWE